MSIELIHLFLQKEERERETEQEEESRRKNRNIRRREGGRERIEGTMKRGEKE